ncbi:MAG: phosphatidylglycerophosphatase A [Vicinamibacterales bacterium]
MARLGLLIATCGYVGYAPVAPGTFGSAVGVAAFYAIRATGSSTAELAAIVLVFAIGVWSATVTERALNMTDPGPVVIDEVVGMLMTLALLPLNGVGVLVGFLVFRVFDVVKPWPAARFEALHGGLGVMADDAMAGIYGNLVMRGLLLLAPSWFS